MQKYGKIRKLPRLPTKKLQKNFRWYYFATYTMQFSFTYPIFRTTPLERGLALFYPTLMAFESVSCYHRTLRPLKCSTIGSSSPSIFRFPRSFHKKRRSFSKKRGRFSEKRGSFFSVPSERRFLTANRNTKKQEMEELQD